MAERTSIGDDGRQRYHGQGRRGRVTIAADDESDFRSAKQALNKGEDGLALFRSPEIQALPLTQRTDTKQAALDQIALAVRFLEEVLERNRYSASTPRNSGR